MQERPIIALIGRPNVGKSTIFNRLIGRREAITSHVAGTTRDRNFGVMQWYRQSWTIVDTAGVLLGEEEDELETSRELQSAMDEQVELAVAEANLVALVVDVKQGIHPTEQFLVETLRKHGKPFVILANKADNASLALTAEEFRELGIEHIFPISGIHGRGIRELVDFLMEEFPSSDEAGRDRLPRVAFIGRPNVGKSTLLNRIVGHDRAIVSNVPGTTRDTIEEEATLPSGTRFTVVDTAGIRRKGKIEAGIEKFSLFRTLRAINHSDIVVLLLTVEEIPSRGDAHVAMYAMEAGKTPLLLINKADLAADNIFKLDHKKRRLLGERFLKRFPFLQRLPFWFISAEEGTGIDDFLRDLETKVSALQPTQTEPEVPPSE